MPGMLLLHADEGEACARWRKQGRAYWQDAFSLVLEKYGYLAVEQRTRRDVSQHQWESYDCVLVCQLPAGDWDDDLISWTKDGSRPVLLEAPFPPALLAQLGVEAHGVSAGADGTLRLLDTELRDRSAAFGYPGGGHVAAGSGRPVARLSELDWRSIPAVGLTETHAQRWKCPGWDLERWSLTDGATAKPEILADFTLHGDCAAPQPAVVRHGLMTAMALSLTAFLGQGHTSHPSDPGEHFSSGRRTGVETAVLALVDDLHARAGASRARVLPWPRGATWARSVRHDYDRQITVDHAEKVLSLHDREGSAATWYWRSRHIELERRPGGRGRQLVSPIELVAAHARSEVALHTELLWIEAARERALVEQAIGCEVAGSSAHGDPGCFRFQGAPNVLWAEREGLLYTEMIEHAHFHPHRFAAVDADGRVEASRVLCLPHHESLDRSSAPGDTNAHDVLEAAGRWQQMSGFLQVMNHPDIHTEELFEVLRAMSSAGRLDLTSREAADWWRASHDGTQLMLSAAADERFEIRSMPGVNQMVLEIRQADGTIRTRVVDIEPGGSVAVSARAVTPSI